MDGSGGDEEEEAVGEVQVVRNGEEREDLFEERASLVEEQVWEDG